MLCCIIRISGLPFQHKAGYKQYYRPNRTDYLLLQWCWDMLHLVTTLSLYFLYCIYNNILILANTELCMSLLTHNSHRLSGAQTSLGCCENKHFPNIFYFIIFFVTVGETGKSICTHPVRCKCNLIIAELSRQPTFIRTYLHTQQWDREGHTVVESTYYL